MIRRGAAALAFLSLWSGLSTFPVWADEPPSPFPELEAIRPNVKFWTRAFSEWSLGQAAIHDLDHPALVYEVVDLPGPIEGAYTDEQRDYLEVVRESWEAYLHALEGKVASGRPLEEIDQQWVLHFATVVGADKLEGAHARVRSQRGLRERFREGLERSFRFDGAIREILREHGLPEELAYLPHVESSFQYRARSSAGATGLWQFTRGTGKQYLTIGSAIDERLDPLAATRGAAAYLSDAHEKLGTWPLALTSYNHGVQGMLRAKQRFGTDFERIYLDYDGRSFGFASKNFYAEFLAARKIASDPDTYFPEGYDPEPAFDLESAVLERRATPYRIANRYGVALDELARLNPAWTRRAVEHGLHLPAGTRVWLPVGTLEKSGGGEASSSPEVHVVQRGETLSGIASRYRVRLADLLSANTLTLRSIIRPGQVLHIP